MPDWSHLFVGRNYELSILKQCFEEAVAGRANAVSIVAESGFGKTRLVQEFYNWLSTHHDSTGKDGYWPDRLLKNENNLLVNPDGSECGLGGQPMPFLWWGLRISDPTARNEVVTGALWGGLDILKPHLGHYTKRLNHERLAKDTRGSLASGALDLAIDAAGNLLTFGLLSTGKTVLQKSKELYDIRSAKGNLDRQDPNPTATRQRANDELSETIIGDLFRLAKQPPGDARPIPLVVIIDDAQWLPSDTGMTAFATLLMERARRERWPLLLVMTSWEREWQESARTNRAPASLLDGAAGDRVVQMTRTPGLEEITSVALPGLDPGQRAALIELVDGNPRFLEEILLFLRRNKKYFVGRDLAAALTDRGLDELKRMELPDFVADRFAEAPEHVRLALGLASTHGVAFSPRMVRFMAEHLQVDKAPSGLAESENPHGFTSLDTRPGLGEFRMRAYRKAAEEDLGNHLDEDHVAEAMTHARALVMDDLAQASDQDLTLVFGGDQENAALKAAAELVRRAEERHDPRTAGEIAAQVIRRFPDLGEANDPKTPWKIIDAHWDWHGPTQICVALLQNIVDHVRKAITGDSDCASRALLAEALLRLSNGFEAMEGPLAALSPREESMALLRTLSCEPEANEVRRDLAVAVTKLGDAVEAIDGPAAARALREEGVNLFSALAKEQETPSSRQDLSIALSRLSDVVEALEGPAAARDMREKQVTLSRDLEQELANPGARRDLAVDLSKLGDVVAALEGPAAVRALREEAAVLFRALVQELATPDARKDLFSALTRLGDVVEALDGPAAARALREEDVILSRALVQELATPGMRRDLAFALSRLGDVIEALEGPAAARALREEVVTLSRVLEHELATPGARWELALALSKLGDVVATLDGPTAARALLEEAVALSRALAQNQPTPGAREGLAFALSRLGDMVVAADGPAASRALFEEVVSLTTDLAKEQSTPHRRRELASALSKLGDVFAMLDGPAAARALREEVVTMSRALAHEWATPGMRRDLAVALSRLGDVVAMLDGPAAARALREEVVTLSRVLVLELATPGARRELAFALSKLSDVVAVLDGPSASRVLFEEAVILFRALAQELARPGARWELVFFLSRLGDLVETLDDLAAARALREEEVTLCRTLAEEQATPDAWRGVAVALSKLAYTVEALDGPSAAHALRQEELTLCRTLAEEQTTPSARWDLALALTRLGDAVEAHDGPAAARALREESVALSRALAQEQPTPDAWQDLAVALLRLGDLVTALNGPTAARALRDEARRVLADLHRHSPSAESLLGLAVTHRDLARDALLGQNPWARAFSLEQVAPEAALSAVEDARTFLSMVEEWTQMTEQADMGWLASARGLLGVCLHACGHHEAALALITAALPAALHCADRNAGDGGQQLASVYFLTARIKSQMQQEAEADADFESALAICRARGPKKVAKDHRLHAAVIWFHTRNLLAIGRRAGVPDLLREGQLAAENFAAFRMQDGAAILNAYQNKST